MTNLTTGDRIRLVRKAQKMNQSEFAKEISVSTTTVCQLETGKYNIARATKHILCTRFHINPAWLDTGEGDMYSANDTAEEVVPELVEILSNYPSLLRAVKQATNFFTIDDWKKLNAFINSLGDEK